jgi:hypothetical protein
MSTQNAIFALIHDQLGDTLMKVFQQGDGLFTADPGNPFRISVLGGEGLVQQLSDGTDGPPKITLAFALDIAGASGAAFVNALEPVFSLPSAGAGPTARIDPAEVLNKVRTALSGQLRVLDQQRNAIAELIAAQNPASILQAGAALFQSIRDAVTASGNRAVFSPDMVDRLQQFIGSDGGAALPLATIVQAMQRSRDTLRNIEQIPSSIEASLLAYFFNRDGYATVDETRVVAPAHLSDLTAAVPEVLEGVASGKGLSLPPQLGGFFSKPTAEHYLRDITRVVVESAYDAGRTLKPRYADIKTRLLGVAPKAGTPEHTVAKFVSWFRGFGALAESAAMRAVEVGTQGVSEFQSNPLIAAAAGSFAGTVARKLAQDSFLTVMKNA